ncbi:MAG: DUF4254 domain-containing protein [Leptospiraceae bacterium]|nr:DUF4254 domain-containing protein [Leptospiraceae bacterium]MCK6381945.1 DUF4254 domain-containing protein [Leptospiraceae bacterium]NUM41818.1 DUF4254 domain-containing protein [Leptospiraceae bacterium]
MELNANNIIKIFQESILAWHKNEEEAKNPFQEESLEFKLFKKNQIDTIQWHVEDEIRRPDIEDKEIVRFKRKIDALNQERTDTVEWLDDYLVKKFESVSKNPNAKMNSETPAWLIDRMSILELKIYHMTEETKRKDVSPSHIETCQKKLEILLDQRKDMTGCLDDLFIDLKNGVKYIKVYRQMKMYNDKNLNPALYKKK